MDEKKNNPKSQRYVYILAIQMINLNSRWSNTIKTQVEVLFVMKWVLHFVIRHLNSSSAFINGYLSSILFCQGYSLLQKCGTIILLIAADLGAVNSLL